MGFDCPVHERLALFNPAGQREEYPMATLEHDAKRRRDLPVVIRNGAYANFSGQGTWSSSLNGGVGTDTLTGLIDVPV